MAEGSYPTLGLGFDFAQIAAAQTSVDALERSILGLAQASAASGPAVTSAVAGYKAVAQAATESAGAAVAASSKAADAEDVSSAKIVASWRTAIAQGKGLWQQRVEDQVASANAAAEGEVAALNRSLAASRSSLSQRMSITKQYLSESMAADQAAAASAAAAISEMEANEALLATFRTDVQAQRVRQSAAADAETMASHAAAVQAQIAEEELLAQMTVDAQLNAARQIQAANAERISQEAQIAAATEASEQAAAAAAQMDADARVKVAAAQLAQIRNGELTVESVEAERLAVISLTEAYAQQAAVKSEQAVSKAVAVGGDTGLAASAASVGPMVAATTATNNYQKSVAALTAEQNADVAAGAKFISSLETTAATYGKSRSDVLTYQAALAGVSAEAAPLIASIKATEESLTHLGTGAGGVTREVVVMFREFLRGDFSRMSQSATILTQRLGFLGALLNPTALAIEALVGSAALVAFEMDQGSVQAAKFSNAIQVTGNYAGITAAQFDEMAQTIASASGQSVGAAEKSMQEMVASGKASGDTLVELGEFAVKFGDQTGQSTDKVIQGFLNAKGNVAQYAATFVEQYSLISAAQLFHIQQLEAEGQQDLALKTLIDDVSASSKNQTVQLGYLDTAWRSLAGSISAALQSLRDFGKEQTAGQQVNNLKADIARNQANPDAYGASAAIIDADNKQIAALQPLVDAENKKAAATSAADKAQRAAAMSGTELAASWKSLGGSASLAQTEIDKIGQQSADVLADPTADPSTEQYKDAAAYTSNPEKYNALIEKKYDRVDQTKKGPGAGQAMSAQLGIDKDEDAVKALQQQIAGMSSSPIGEIGGAIEKAYTQALTGYTDTTNASKVKEAQLKAEVDAQKAAETETLKSVEAESKATVADNQRAAALQGQIDGTTAAAAAINAYYSGTTDYVSALQAQANATLQATNAASDLSIAQKYGATSVEGISKAIQDQELAAKNSAGQSVISAAAAKADGDAVQVMAEKHLAATVNVNALTEAQKTNAAFQSNQTAALANIDNLNKEAAAYALGTAGLAAFDRQKQLDQSLVGIVQANPNSDPTVAAENAARIAKAQADVDSANQAAAIDNQAKLNAAAATQLRLSTETTQERATDAEVQARITDLLKEGVGYTQDSATAQAKVEASLRQQVTDAAKLKISIQDSIRDGFAETGKLDFSKFTDLLEQDIRKSIYDALIAKPLDLIINATVDYEKQALSSIFGSSSSTSGLGGITSLFGGGSAPMTAAQTNSINAGIGQDLDGFTSANVGATADAAQTTVGTLTSGFTSVVSALAPIAGVAALGEGIGQVLGQLVGQNAKQQSLTNEVSPFVGGIIGTIIGSLFGGQPTNAGATATFNAAGDVTGVGGDKANATTTQGANTVASAVSQTITGLAALGINASGILNSFTIGQRDTSIINLSNGTVDRNAAAGDTDALNNEIDKDLLLNATYTDPQMKALVDQMIAANASFSDISTALQNYSTAQSDVASLSTANLQYTDPLAYQLAQLATSQAARQSTLDSQISSGYLTTTQATTAQADVKALDTSEIQNALNTYATTTDSAAKTMADFQTAQTSLIAYAKGLLTGSLSPLSPTDQLAQDKTAYTSDVTGAKAGDYASLNDLQTSAQAYLTQAQQYYGSTSQYADIFSQVQSDLNTVGTQADVASPETDAINTASADLTAAIGSGAADIIAALKALSGTTASGTGSSTTSTGTTTTTTAGGGTTTGGNSDVVAAIGSLIDATGNGLATVAATTAAGAASTASTVLGATGTATALGGGLITKYSGSTVRVQQQ